ncbi:MAG: hypothetical protein H0V69_05700 [Acidimicrobiia bacterium]|jgi:hypothetical protein|nr:hypothetical protein [Acidimicrobiia bacterium]MDQ3391858.1 hypothetical protein [Actinomycetota bacterium]
MLRRFRTLMNPLSRTAILTVAWSRRQDVMRWGRSLWTELHNPDGISPARLATVGRVLLAVTSDTEASGAKELRQVRLDGDTVVLDVDPRWNRVGRLSDRLLKVKGVKQVMTETGQRLHTVSGS